MNSRKDLNHNEISLSISVGLEFSVLPSISVTQNLRNLVKNNPLPTFYSNFSGYAIIKRSVNYADLTDHQPRQFHVPHILKMPIDAILRKY